MIATAVELAEALERNRSSRPDALAVADGEMALSWEDLGEAVAATATALARWRAEPGATVVLALPSSSSWAVAFLACRAAGFAVASAGAPRSRADLRGLCLETGAAGIVGTGPTSRWVRSVAAELGAAHLCLGAPDGAARPSGPPVQRPLQPGVAALHFTSGSTGERKAVPRSEASLVNEGQAIAQVLGPSAGPILIVSPVFHSFGAGLLSAALVSAAPAVLLPRYSLGGVLEAIAAHGVAIVVAVPYVFQCLTRIGWSRRHEVGSVRLGIAGGTPLHEEVGDRFRERFGATLAQEYGLSEVGVVSLNVDDPDGRPWSVGRALPGLEVSSAPHPGARGEDGDGEVVVHCGPDRELGAVASEPIPTGDVGRVDSAGFLRISGRIKHMVNVGGVKVAPHDVERRLLDGGEMEDVAVVAVPDPLLGERVAAAVVPRAGTGLTRGDFHAHCSRALAPHEIPRRVLWLDSLPRLQSGKPDLQAIRRQLASSTR